MKIVSYNIQYAKGKDGRHDLARIADAVRGADLIGLQEVTRHFPGVPPRLAEQPERLAELLPEYFWAYAPPLDLDAGCAEALLHLAESDRRAGAPQGLVEDRLRAGIAAAHTLETEAALRCALAWHLVGQERRAEARLATSGIEATLTRVAAPARDRLRLRLCELLLAQGQAERARELMAGAAS